MAKKEGYNPYAKKKKPSAAESKKDSTPEAEEPTQRVISKRGQIVIAVFLAALGVGLGVFLHTVMGVTGTAATVVSGIYAANCWIAMVMKFGVKSPGATAVAVLTSVLITIYTLATGSFSAIG